MKLILLISIINLTNIYAASPIAPAPIGPVTSPEDILNLRNQFKDAFATSPDYQNSSLIDFLAVYSSERGNDYKKDISYCYNQQFVDRATNYLTAYDVLLQNMTNTLSNLASTSEPSTYNNMQTLYSNFQQFVTLAQCLLSATSDSNYQRVGIKHHNTNVSELGITFNTNITNINNLMNTMVQNWPSSDQSRAFIINFINLWTNINNAFNDLLTFDGANDAGGLIKNYQTYINAMKNNSFLIQANTIYNNFGDFTVKDYNYLNNNIAIVKAPSTTTNSGTVNYVQDLMSNLCQLKKSLAEINDIADIQTFFKTPANTDLNNQEDTFANDLNTIVINCIKLYSLLQTTYNAGTPQACSNIAMPTVPN